MTIEADLQSIIDEMEIPLFGISTAEPSAHFSTFEAWIRAGKHAGMGYLARADTLEKRAHPGHLMTGARSMLVFGIPHTPPPRTDQTFDQPHGRLAAFACMPDYHERIPRLLAEMAERIHAELHIDFQWRVFTDSAPILERSYAQRTGLGWMGKNTCLIAPRIGSYFFLAEMITDLDLQPTPAFEKDFCGTCQRCVDACPTGCISADDRTIDARRCLSYLTIENKGAIPTELRPLLGDRLFGCDVCQQVCPWNQRIPDHHAHPALGKPQSPYLDLHTLAAITPEEFKQRFSGSPLLRAKRPGLLRNLACVLGNLRDPRSILPLSDLLSQENDPLVRSHAAWALGRFEDESAQRSLAHARSVETDPAVLTEIETALAE